MKAAIVFALAAPCMAQITSVTVTYDQGSAQYGGPHGSAGYGGSITANGTGTGALDITSGGTPCTGMYTSLGGNGATFTAGVPARFTWARVESAMDSGVNDKQFTCSGTIGSQPFSLTTNQRRWSPLFVTDFNGNLSPFTSASCTAVNSFYAYTSDCPYTSGYPPSWNVPIPTGINYSWTDPNFGAVWVRATTTQSQPTTNHRWNATDQYFLSDDAGIVEWNAATRTATTRVAPFWTTGFCTGGGASRVFWSRRSSTPLDGWCFSSDNKKRIQRWRFDPNTNTVSEIQFSAAAWFTYSDDMENNGGDGPGWGYGTGLDAYDRVFVPVPSTNEVCLIDLPNRVLIDCVGRFATQNFRSVQIGLTRDYGTGLQYFAVGSDDDGGTGSISSLNLFTLNKEQTTLSQLSYLTYRQNSDIGTSHPTKTYGSGVACVGTPSGDSTCIRGGHNMMYNANGRTWSMGNALGTRNNSGYYSSWSHVGLSAYPFHGVPEEWGGGFVTRFPAADEYGGCSVKGGLCVQAGSLVDDQTRYRPATASGNGTTLTFTITSGTNLYATSDQIIVNGCSVAAFNGYFTVLTAVASTFTVSNATTNTATGCYTAKATTPTGGNSGHSHIAVFRPNGHMRFTKNPHCGTSDGYFMAPSVISTNLGNWVGINGSLCFPAVYGLWILDTGFRCTGRETNADFCNNGYGGIDVRPITGGIRVLVRAPRSDASCSVTYSPTADWSSSTTTSTDTGSRTFDITGLSAGDQRFFKVWCDGNDPYSGEAKTNWHYAIADTRAK